MKVSSVAELVGIRAVFRVRVTEFARFRAASGWTAWFALFMCLVPLGCSGRPEGFVPVSGEFKYQDGTPLKGVSGYVRFYPLDPASPDTDDSRLEGKLSEQIATGELTEDGQFELSTVREGDGVKPGNYKIVMFMENVEPGPPIVPERYRTYATPQWKVQVQPDEPNHFPLTIERQ